MADTPPKEQPDTAQNGPELDERQRRQALLFMLEDLQASRAQIERARKQWTDAFDAVRDPIFLHDKDFRVVRANRAYAKAAGMAIEDVIGKRYWEVFPKNEGPLPACARHMEKAEEEEEEEVTLPTGEVLVSRGFAIRDDEGRYVHSIHMLEDITGMRRAEVALRRSAAELKEAQRVARLGSWVLDTETGNVIWTEELYRVFGLDPALPAPGYEEHHRILTPESYARMDAAIEKARQTGEPYEIDLELVRPDGTRKWITARGEARRDPNGQIVGLRGTALDITERKRAEEALRRTNRALRTLSVANEALVHARTEQELLKEICRVAVEVGGYAYAWIGYAEHDPQRRIRPVAQVGFTDGFIEALPLAWADNELGKAPAGTAIREGMTVVIEDAATDPRLSAWHDHITALGIGSGCALPLLSDVEAFGAFCVYLRESGTFEREELALLSELAEDLTYGILTLRQRVKHGQLQQERLKSAERLKETLTDTIRAIALTVEKRDPYTAGHQRKVADLCAAIGRELELPEDCIEGLRLGATIHDIGKIYVPAEILNRPGKLTDAEFEIIKSHPGVGYDIVKDVKFPWPVGEMLLQHHERLNGSGYPRGLKGEDILLEARIMAVADTVEAMSSHRPYRPALGFEKALAEIEKNRGITYDAAAVDACLRLFKEKGFNFSP
jgi:PAS domain S-box-containing protein